MRYFEACIALICAGALSVEAANLSTHLSRRERERDRERPQNVRPVTVRQNSGQQRWVF